MRLRAQAWHAGTAHRCGRTLGVGRESLTPQCSAPVLLALRFLSIPAEMNPRAAPKGLRPDAGCFDRRPAGRRVPSSGGVPSAHLERLLDGASRNQPLHHCLQRRAPWAGTPDLYGRFVVTGRSVLCIRLHARAGAAAASWPEAEGGHGCCVAACNTSAEMTTSIWVRSCYVPGKDQLARHQSSSFLSMQ